MIKYIYYTVYKDFKQREGMQQVYCTLRKRQRYQNRRKMGQINEFILRQMISA